MQKLAKGPSTLQLTEKELMAFFMESINEKVREVSESPDYKGRTYIPAKAVYSRLKSELFHLRMRELWEFFLVEAKFLRPNPTETEVVPSQGFPAQAFRFSIEREWVEVSINRNAVYLLYRGELYL